ncbi:MAG: leucine-rich repeat protein [Clostridiales bacterium]|jgi:uncharacterized repeat protein (TIGR02543 family)|nr:leucine-rich repeat protein [Clostridiales bacterium]
MDELKQNQTIKETTDMMVNADTGGETETEIETVPKAENAEKENETKNEVDDTTAKAMAKAENVSVKNRKEESFTKKGKQKKLSKKQKRGLIAICIAAVLMLGIGIPVGIQSQELIFIRIDGGYAVVGGWAAEQKTEIVIPETHNGKPVIAIGYESKNTLLLAFSGYHELTSITLPNSITSIGYAAFSDCWNLTSIELPNVTSIGERAFSNCSGLTSIELPNVTSVGAGAFDNCDGLTSINVDESNLYYSTLDGVLYNKDKTILIAYPGGKTGAAFTAPNSVTSIGEGAFSGCSGLTTITLPNVTSIGDWAFYNCSGLTTITLPNVTSIGDAAFAFCGGLTTITLPKVTSIGNEAFRGCRGLIKITLPNVTSIGYEAFSYCGYPTIYVEASSKPSGWNSYWNGSNRPVVWGCTLSADKSYVVSFTKTASSIDNLTADYGISAPYREGYTFDGWATSAGSTTAAYEWWNVNNAANGVTLYAIWIKK